MKELKALPMADPAKLDWKKSREYWSEILDMCHSPSRKYDEVVLIRDIGEPGYVKGSRGIARPFNPVDIYNLQEDYYYVMESGSKCRCRLRNMSEAFEFFPIVNKDGRKVVSMFHTSITRFDFKVVKRKNAQFELNFEI